jgi:hypothetical protein
MVVSRPFLRSAPRLAMNRNESAVICVLGRTRKATSSASQLTLRLARGGQRKGGDGILGIRAMWLDYVSSSIQHRHWKERKKMKRRYFAVLVAVQVVASMLLAACGAPATPAPPSGPSGSVEIFS